MILATCRVVRLGETSVTIHFDPASPAGRIVDVVVPGAGVVAAAATNVTIEVDAPPAGPIRMARNQATIYVGASAGDAAGVLLEDVTRTLVAECRSGMVLHAGLVGWRGRALILAGGSGAGKTTLAAWLVRCGLTYASDEIAVVSHDAAHAMTFPRPLAFKHTGARVLQRWIGDSVLEGATLATPLATLVPPALLGVADYAAVWPPAAVIFPVRQAVGGAVLHPLSSAETAFHLMGTLVNARHLEGHGLSAVIGLARRVKGYRLNYRDVEEVRPDAIATW